METNPKLSLEELSLIERRIETNVATVRDFENLDYFLSSVNAGGYILRKFNSYGINSYEEYILERQKPYDKRKKEVDGLLLGVIQGAILALKDFLSIN